MGKALIALRGGTGAIHRASLNPSAEQEKRYIEAFGAAIEAGQAVLEAGGRGGPMTLDREGKGMMPVNRAGMPCGYGYLGDAPAVGIDPTPGETDATE